MKYDLKTVREEYGYTEEEMAHFVDIMPIYYKKYEKEGEIPSKYIYRLWLKLPDFPLPDDFFKYTSFVLKVNMVYHNMTQKQIAEMFDIRNQSTISSLYAKNIPMYELKEKFHKFKPFIIPVINIDSDMTEDNVQLFPCKCIDSLCIRGNFLATQKKKETKIKKEMLISS